MPRRTVAPLTARTWTVAPKPGKTTFSFKRRDRTSTCGLLSRRFRWDGEQARSRALHGAFWHEGGMYPRRQDGTMSAFAPILPGGGREPPEGGCLGSLTPPARRPL